MRIPKRTWPMKKVVDREQDFRSSDDYPDGFIKETLECGHVYLNDIAVSTESHKTQANRRRCRSCAEAAAQK